MPCLGLTLDIEGDFLLSLHLYIQGRVLVGSGNMCPSCRLTTTARKWETDVNSLTKNSQKETWFHI